MSTKCPAPMSPDLTSVDTSVWGYLKNFVSLVQNNGRLQMKARINDAVATVTRNMLKTTEQQWNILWIFDVPPGVATLKPVGLKSMKVFLCSNAYRTSQSEHMARYSLFWIITVHASCMKNVQCSDSAATVLIKNLYIFYCVLCIDSTPNLLRLL